MRIFSITAAFVLCLPAMGQSQSVKELLQGTWQCEANLNQDGQTLNGAPYESRTNLKMTKTYGPKKVQTTAWFSSTYKTADRDEVAYVSGVYSARWRANRKSLVYETSPRTLKDALPGQKPSKGLLRQVLRGDIGDIVTGLFYPATVKFLDNNRTVWTREFDGRKFECKRAG